MVHALGEIHRVLKPGGFLLDVRPLETNWPVEVAGGKEHLEVGRMTSLPAAVADDEAAERAMTEAAARDWFHKEAQESIAYFYYWDRPSEMKEFVETEWEALDKLEEGVFLAARSAWASAGAEARVRVRVSIQIARWKKN